MTNTQISPYNPFPFLSSDSQRYREDPQTIATQRSDTPSLKTNLDRNLQY